MIEAVVFPMHGHHRCRPSWITVAGPYRAGRIRGHAVAAPCAAAGSLCEFLLSFDLGRMVRINPALAA
jgi:hypothetical protein